MSDRRLNRRTNLDMNRSAAWKLPFVASMRRLALRVDQLPAWAFVGLAIIAFGAARAGRLFALLRQSRGGMELGGFVALAVFLVVLIFAVRRRQFNAWQSTVQVMGSLVVGNAVALVLIWPFVPGGYDVSLTPMLRDTITAGTAMSFMALPPAIAMLWLSRRFGSHSQLTERRGRVVREVLRKRLSRHHRPDSTAA